MSMRAVLTGAALVGAGVTLCGCRKAEETPAPDPVAPIGPTQKAWNNHFQGFADGANQKEGALDTIMKDYDDESVIAVFNDFCEGNKVAGESSRDGYAEFKGKEEIRGFFDGLFKDLLALSNVNFVGPTGGAPVVTEGPLTDKGKANVFLTWKTSLTGATEIKYATDTFSWKNEAGVAKVWKQNIVATQPGVACAPVAKAAQECATADPKPDMCAAWDNHLTAFSAGAVATTDDARTLALDDIMKDYTAESLVQVFDNNGDVYTSFSGPAPIRGMFDKLFKDIQAAKVGEDIGLAVKLLEVEPKFNGVFLVWESKSHLKGTDTFVFNDAGKIIRQNIVALTKTAAEVKVQV